MSALPNDSFSLHQQLARDTLFITDLALCRVLLMNDARYPWCILVPKIPDVREVFDLPASAQAEMWREVGIISERLAMLTKAGKMNVATLGNLVPQLHIHVIARNVGDAAWPQPVWGKGEAQPYTAPAGTKRVEALQLTFAR